MGYTQKLGTSSDSATGAMFQEEDASAGHVNALAAQATEDALAAANAVIAAVNSATQSATSATQSATSAAASNTSATASSTSATQAATSAVAASTSATQSANSATQSATSATQSANSATASADSATQSAASATQSATSATQSANSATASANSATAAASSASDALTSATASAASAASAAASLDNFDDRYLGAKASDPTLDNDGNALVVGALYYRNTTPVGMRVWDGSTWLVASTFQQGVLRTGDIMTGPLVLSGNAAQPLQAVPLQQMDAQSAGMKNRLINANFIVNQRSYVSGTAASVANTYAVDRWRIVAASQSLTWTDNGGVRTVVCPADGIEQVIENINLFSGTYCVSWNGTASCTVNGVAVAKGGTFVADGVNHYTVRFSNGTLWLPQVEWGTRSTAFEFRPLDIETALCTRYYETGIVGGPTNNEALFSSGAVATGPFIGFRTQKRAVPAMTFRDFAGILSRFSDLSGGVHNQVVTAGSPVGNASVFGFCPDFIATGSGLNRWSIIWAAESEL